ncbi:MAG TPA: hypothetical protein VNN73_00830 [Blastocatellia bacterium]|nr:hypothetical protein [Blastocatellia bacterium]
MKIPAKVVVAILVVVVLAGAGLWAQRASTTIKPIKLSGHDVELLVTEVLPPEAREQILSGPDANKTIVTELKSFFAVAQQAELEGYAEKLKSEISLDEDAVLSAAYKQKHPEVKVTDEDVRAYFQSNPTALDDFLKANPQLQENARKMSPEQMRDMRRNYGEFKILAERARNEKLDQDEVVRLRMLFRRSQTLYGAYAQDLEKRIDAQIKPEDVEQYYRMHQDELSKQGLTLDDPRVRQGIMNRVKSEKIQERINQIAASNRVEIAENFTLPQKQAAPQEESGSEQQSDKEDKEQ